MTPPTGASDAGGSARRGRPAAGARTAGVVPAAGASRRMGSPKGLLELEGVTFVRRVVAALSEGACEPVIVVVAHGDDALAGEARAAGAEVLRNPDPGEGPVTSLRLALDAIGAGAGGVAYLPLDHPLVRPATVRDLVDAAAWPAETLVIPTHRGRRGHPTLFGAPLFAELADPALRGGARTVVHRHLRDARLVEVPDPGVLVDVDTPESYAALRRSAAGGEPA